MSLRSLAQRIAILLLPALFAVPVQARDFTDSAQRRVVLPAQIYRIMPAGQAAAVLAFVLAPDKLAGWSTPLPDGASGYLPPHYLRLPVLGRLTGPRPTANVATVRWVRPDLIIDAGPVSPQRVAFANYIEQATGVPYIIIDDSLQRSPDVLRSLGAVLGVEKHAEDLASYAEHAIMAVRGTLLIVSPSRRPRIYLARGWDGLATVVPQTRTGEEIDESGAINVAAPLGMDGSRVMTPRQLLLWNPEIIIAEDPGSYDDLRRDPGWRGLAAVRKKRIYLAPRLPFGWIGDPPGVNRLIGLYWLSAVLYHTSSSEDLATLTSEFYQKFYGVTLTPARLEGLVRSAGIPAETMTPIEGVLPELGAAPRAGTPAVPGVPGMPEVPGISAIPALPAAPGISPAPGALAAPRRPGRLRPAIPLTPEDQSEPNRDLGLPPPPQ